MAGLWVWGVWVGVQQRPPGLSEPAGVCAHTELVCQCLCAG